MAVIVSNGATNLSTASGFYRAETYNLSPMLLAWLGVPRTFRPVFMLVPDVAGIT